VFNYCELITNGIYNRGNVIKFPDHITSGVDFDYYGRDITEAFYSVFNHTEDYKVWFETKEDSLGYNGRVWTKYLFWDMDGKTALEDTRWLVDRLSVYNQENIRVYYSGNKGFHVFYYCPELEAFVDHPQIETLVKNTCLKLVKGLPSVDTKIYNKSRVLRITNSIHRVSKLYKIPISFDELSKLNINEIRELAIKQRKISYNHSHEQDDELIDFLSQVANEGYVSESDYSGSDNILNGILNGFSEGDRNTGLFRVAGMLHSRAIDENFTRAFIMAINNNSNTPLPEEEINNIIRSVLKYPINKEYIPAAEKDIVTIKEASQTWFNIITTSGVCDFGERFKHINDRLKMCIPGDVIAVVAESGVGKTSIGMELGNNEAKSRKMYSLFNSLEMSQAGVYFRAATMEFPDNEDGRVISSNVAKKLLEKGDFHEAVCEQWKNLLIVDKSNIDIQKIRDYYAIAQEKTGFKVSNIIIDYAQNLKHAEDITQSMRMARQLKELAKDLETIVIVLMQCNKTIPDSYTEVQKNHIEGAGAYYQACDYILGFWRSRSDKFRLHGKMLKDRWNEAGYKFDLVREGLKFHTEEEMPEPRGGVAANDGRGTLL
jgi:hypothetical protein